MDFDELTSVKCVQLCDARLNFERPGQWYALSECHSSFEIVND